MLGTIPLQLGVMISNGHLLVMKSENSSVVLALHFCLEALGWLNQGQSKMVSSKMFHSSAEIYSSSEPPLLIVAALTMEPSCSFIAS